MNFKYFFTFHDCEYITWDRDKKDESSKSITTWNEIVADAVWKEILLKPVANSVHSVVDQIRYGLILSNEFINELAILSYRHHVSEIWYSEGDESKTENLAVFSLGRNVAITNRRCESTREEKRIVVVPSIKLN